jgi:hypothetical protein
LHSHKKKKKSEMSCTQSYKENLRNKRKCLPDDIGEPQNRRVARALDNHLPFPPLPFGFLREEEAETGTRGQASQLTSHTTP